MSDGPMSPPISDNRDEWNAYWMAQGEPWRTEPEITPERKRKLAEHRDTVTPNIQQGVYPFKDVLLSRADVEWLLHEHGPINWSDENQRLRPGLDLRGAILSKVDLRDLPLNKVRLGLSFDEWKSLDAQNRRLRTLEQRLEIFKKRGNNLEAHELQESVEITHLLELREAAAAHLEEANFRGTYLQGGDLRLIHLESARLDLAHLEEANLHGARLAGASLVLTHLEGASLEEADLVGDGSMLLTTDLHLAIFNEATTIRDIKISSGNSRHRGSSVKLRDISWNGVNLAILRWNSIIRLGDETEALNPRIEKELKPRTKRIEDWERAVRAYRQMAATLRIQGVNEVADYFAYRAQLCQRRVTRFGGLRTLPAYLGSLLLDLISGYGYRPARSLATYALVIGVFALIYGVLGQNTHPLNTQESIVVSMTAFHGRGFFATSFSPGDPQAVAAAVEAFVGLFIEVTFIATFTQRFFSR